MLARAAYGEAVEARDAADHRDRARAGSSAERAARAWHEIAERLPARRRRDRRPRCFVSNRRGKSCAASFRRTTRKQWCNRRVLARIHRSTIGTLRREIEPVTAAAYVTFLQRWQHVAPASRLHGIDGTVTDRASARGLRNPAFAWEEQILPARVAGYQAGVAR